MMSLFDLSGQVSLITGAGRGIGRSIALGLAEAGSDVVLCSRSQEELEAVAVEVRKHGVRALVTPCDVRDPGQISAVVDQAIDEFGRIDVLVNNAGLTIKKPAEELPLDDWQTIIDVNLTGVFLMAQAVGRHMLSQRGGRIINISSIAAKTGLSGSSAYCASKGGVDMLTRTLAVEWAERGVRVNGLAPAYTETPLVKAITDTRADFAERVQNRTPMKRMARPDEMVGTAIFLASEASSYVTGETIMVDGGWTALGA
ncbi:gluconate 5-dehydrogenase/2-deoxy-D-gluconate 3-dehydrogenase [Marinobacter daqiaonensis]|uniref:Gluconate 5-dehydrogenase/2-deoxy-D-gluconate 3-dehydrogenase n=1 Tax=Marinobacter daqiaonensis TaxID=650891 RepID=A0A1I6JFQ2_9GAMM|nr:glucose 1-dehydrogenase [Marinobacter daqiaonensis]SFR77795.1 gluconate 5-dehydrogenase/2-deoxy-D-gluconate 3-dehydrogenase [Marinobacter daqiaonensis]